MQSKTYFKAFGALLGLLALTVGAHYLHLGPFGAAVAMTISVAKALVIILFFMEVRGSPPLIWLFASAGFLWLALMLILLLSDYETRSWISPDWRAGVNGSKHIPFTEPSPN